MKDAALDVIALALIVLCVAAWCIYAELREGNVIAQTRLDADLVTSYEAANIVMDLYKQIALYSRNDSIKSDMVARAESYMAQRGVLRGWKPIKEAAAEKERAKGKP
jgi:hypothetical protein